MNGSMSAIGTKRTSEPNRLMSAIGGKADISQRYPDPQSNLNKPNSYNGREKWMRKKHPEFFTDER